MAEQFNRSGQKYLHTYSLERMSDKQPAQEHARLKYVVDGRVKKRA